MEKLYNYLFKPERNVTDISLELIDFKFRELCEFTRDYWDGCYHSCDLYAPHAINAHYKKWSEFITFTNLLDPSAQKIIKELPKYKQLLTDFDEISALNTEYEREYTKCSEDTKCRYHIYCKFCIISEQSVIWNKYNMYMVHDILATSLFNSPTMKDDEKDKGVLEYYSRLKSSYMDKSIDELKRSYTTVPGAHWSGWHDFIKYIEYLKFEYGYDKIDDKKFEHIKHDYETIKNIWDDHIENYDRELNTCIATSSEGTDTEKYITCKNRVINNAINALYASSLYTDANRKFYSKHILK